MDEGVAGRWRGRGSEKNEGTRAVASGGPTSRLAIPHPEAAPWLRACGGRSGPSRAHASFWHVSSQLFK